MGAIRDSIDKEREERKIIKGSHYNYVHLVVCCIIAEAIQMMSTVANHINEMQRVCEAYQLVFECMLKSSQITEVGHIILAVHLYRWMDYCVLDVRRFK